MKEQIEQDPWLIAIVSIQFFAGVSGLLLCAAVWSQRGVLLRYEPRRPVPWGIIGALLAVTSTALIIANALAAKETAIEVAQQQPEVIVQSLVASIVMQSLGPVLLLVLAAAVNATRSDIGLPPPSAAAWARDIGIGVVACLAAIIPVGIVNIVARIAFNTPDELTKHQLVEMLTETRPGIGVMALAAFVAIVAAPIGEEITFRLLLQGWLEKWEDRQIGRLAVPDLPANPDDLVGTALNLEAAAEHTGDNAGDATPLETSPPKSGVCGLPHGWTPIFVSSWLFAAAHFGYGPEPIPLFVLALVLGYCYQRTHRIVPSIVAHGLFNLFSMITLWRMIALNEG